MMEVWNEKRLDEIEDTGCFFFFASKEQQRPTGCVHGEESAFQICRFGVLSVHSFSTKKNRQTSKFRPNKKTTWCSCFAVGSEATPGNSCSTLPQSSNVESSVGCFGIESPIKCAIFQ